LELGGARTSTPYYGWAVPEISDELAEIDDPKMTGERIPYTQLVPERLFGKSKR
jgi:hypothetical protein